jgi:hypothetical protein
VRLAIRAAYRLFSSPRRGSTLVTSRRLQVQLPLPYGRESRDDERVRRQLDQGWRISQLQRLSDQEVLVTFERPSSDQP